MTVAIVAGLSPDAACAITSYTVYAGNLQGTPDLLHYDSVRFSDDWLLPNGCWLLGPRCGVNRVKSGAILVLNSLRLRWPLWEAELLLPQQQRHLS